MKELFDSIAPQNASKIKANLEFHKSLDNFIMQIY